MRKHPGLQWPGSRRRAFSFEMRVDDGKYLDIGRVILRDIYEAELNSVEPLRIVHDSDREARLILVEIVDGSGRKTSQIMGSYQNRCERRSPDRSGSHADSRRAEAFELQERMKNLK